MTAGSDDAVSYFASLSSLLLVCPQAAFPAACVLVNSCKQFAQKLRMTDSCLNNKKYSFPAHDELGMCEASLVPSKQPVLSILARFDYAM